jgi:hypothetical protein
VGLKSFGEHLRAVITSIVPIKTPINLVLDGLLEDTGEEEGAANYAGFRIGPAPLEVSLALLSN